MGLKGKPTYYLPMVPRTSILSKRQDFCISLTDLAIPFENVLKRPSRWLYEKAIICGIDVHPTAGGDATQL